MEDSSENNQDEDSEDSEEEEENEDVFEVEKIIDTKRAEGGKRFYFVRWRGYGPEDDSWEPDENLLSCEDLLKEYWRTIGRKKRKGNKEKIQPKKLEEKQHQDCNDTITTNEQKRNCYTEMENSDVRFNDDISKTVEEIRFDAGLTRYERRQLEEAILQSKQEAEIALALSQSLLSHAAAVDIPGTGVKDSVTEDSTATSIDPEQPRFSEELIANIDPFDASSNQADNIVIGKTDIPECKPDHDLPVISGIKTNDNQDAKLISRKIVPKDQEDFVLVLSTSEESSQETVNSGGSEESDVDDEVRKVLAKWGDPRYSPMKSKEKSNRKSSELKAKAAKLKQIISQTSARGETVRLKSSSGGVPSGMKNDGCVQSGMKNDGCVQSGKKNDISDKSGSDSAEKTIMKHSLNISKPKKRHGIRSDTIESISTSETNVRKDKEETKKHPHNSTLKIINETNQGLIQDDKPLVQQSHHVAEQGLIQDDKPLVQQQSHHDGRLYRPSSVKISRSMEDMPLGMQVNKYDISNEPTVGDISLSKQLNSADKSEPSKLKRQEDDKSAASDDSGCFAQKCLPLAAVEYMLDNIEKARSSGKTDKKINNSVTDNQNNETFETEKQLSHRSLEEKFDTQTNLSSKPKLDSKCLPPSVQNITSKDLQIATNKSRSQINVDTVVPPASISGAMTSSSAQNFASITTEKEKNHISNSIKQTENNAMQQNNRHGNAISAALSKNKKNESIIEDKRRKNAIMEQFMKQTSTPLGKLSKEQRLGQGLQSREQRLAHPNLTNVGANIQLEFTKVPSAPQNVQNNQKDAMKQGHAKRSGGSRKIEVNKNKAARFEAKHTDILGMILGDSGKTKPELPSAHDKEEQRNKEPPEKDNKDANNVDTFEGSDVEFDLDDCSCDEDEVYPTQERSKTIENADVNSIKAISMTIDEYRNAILQGDNETILGGIVAGHDANLVDQNSLWSPLFWSVDEGEYHVVAKLLKLGANPNIAAKGGKTPLMLAVDRGKGKLSSLLLRGGACVNAQQTNGETALMMACRKGYEDLVHLLLNNGADISITSLNRQNALHYVPTPQVKTVKEIFHKYSEKLREHAESVLAQASAGVARIINLPLLTCRCVSPGEPTNHEFSFELPTSININPSDSGIVVVLLCASATFHDNGAIDLTLDEQNNGIQSVFLDDKKQLPVVKGYRSLYFLFPKVGHWNTLSLQTNKCGYKLLVTVYALMTNQDRLNEVACNLLVPLVR